MMDKNGDPERRSMSMTHSQPSYNEYCWVNVSNKSEIGLHLLSNYLMLKENNNKMKKVGINELF